MNFKRYAKIYQIEKKECKGIMKGTCYIQEKLDGANASIWLEEDGIHYGSRSRDLKIVSDDFRGFGTWVKEHPKLIDFFNQYPTTRLNGEWLVKHTISYNQENYKKFYCFDMEDVKLDDMYEMAKHHNIPTVALFAVISNPTLDQIKSYAGKSVLGDKGEGVVVKNFNFINKYGDRAFGKYVVEEFKEHMNTIFGNNDKLSETYYEQYYVNKFVTLARVRKIIHKLEMNNDNNNDGVRGIDKTMIPKIMGMCYYDIHF